MNLAKPVWIPKRCEVKPKKDVTELTDKQREEIRKMRLNGLGYKMIAKLLDLGENNVYTYCKTHGLSGSAELIKLNYPIWCQQNSRCMICGTKITQPKTGRRKKFCSGRCRTRYCREKKEER